MSEPELPEAVLWDMDGTIIDTEPYWMEQERLLVVEAGGTWSHEDALALVGNDLSRSAQIILERTPVTGTPTQVVLRLLEGVVASTRAEIPWRPGARELLAECGALGIPNALVTMSWDSLAQVLLEALPVDTFATVVTGDVVARGKPHPEPYLLAARRLGADPGRCVAIEDSPTGVASATAAGVPTLAVPHVVPVPAQGGARLVQSLEGIRARDLVRLTSIGATTTATTDSNPATTDSTPATTIPVTTPPVPTTATAATTATAMPPVTTTAAATPPVTTTAASATDELRRPG